MVAHAVVERASGSPGTLASLGRGLLGNVGAAAGLAAPDLARAGEWFDMLAEHWGTLRVDRGPQWPSDITDDHTPFELSLAFKDSDVETRLLAEVGPGQERRDRWLIESWRRAKAFNEGIERLGVELDRLHVIQDLFQPGSSEARFAMWHGLCFRADAKPHVKVYLNPCVAGDPGRTVAAALERLQQSWVLSRLSSVDLSRSTYLAVDLSSGSEARTKVYVAHPSGTADDVERAVSVADDYESGRASALCRSLGGDGPYSARPVLTCFAAVERSRSLTATVHFPVRCYVRNDSETLGRIKRRLPPGSAHAYERALAAFARRPLGHGTGMQTYVSQSLAGAGDRYTIYLAPEAYGVSATEEQ